MKLAKSVKLSNTFTHTYFSARENSATNTFTAEMFRKLALIQQDKVKWLQDNDELEQFIEQKFETYAKNNILGRLDKVTDEEKAECESIVKDMLNVFAPFYKGEDEILLNAMEITKVQLEELENEQLSQSELDISQKQLKKLQLLQEKRRDVREI